MPKKRSVWLQEIYDAVADGERHKFMIVAVRASKKVDPGRVDRYIERRRNTPRDGETPRERQRKRCDEDTMVSAAVAIASGRIRDLIRGGTLISEIDENGDEYIQLMNHATISVRELAELIGRADTTLHGWIRTPERRAQIEKLTPPGVEICSRTPNNNHSTRIPRLAIPAWKTYSDSQRTVTPFREKDAIEALIATFEIPADEGPMRLAKLKRELMKRDLWLRQGLGYVPVADRQPEGAEES